jgi:hypothetical protein
MIGNALPPEFIRRHAVEIHKSIVQEEDRMHVRADTSSADERNL